MKFRYLLVLVIIAALIEIIHCQGLRRRKLRPRLQPAKDEEEQVAEVEEEEEEEAESPGIGPRLRTRQRALGARMEADYEARGQRPGRLRPGRRRPAGGRRPGRLRRLRGRRPLPVYEYDDYYYDYNYDDYYYYDDYPSASGTGSGTGSGSGSGSRFSSGTGSGSAAGAEISDSSDPKDIIQKLWEEFLQEKRNNKPSEPEPEYECPPQDDVSYYLPDEEQCDRYLECNIKGELRPHLCPDGFVFDINLEKCDYPVKVNCTGRPLLQEPQPSVNCSRANGFFAWPANVSCQNFWDCREGTAYKQTCPVGVIFDPQLNTCATPDQSSRKECTEGEESFLGFQCPRYAPDSVLRFGNHDRLPHPEDCQSYFTCLITGGPRLANCGRKKVFNNATGQCSDPKNVPGCETYWIEKLKEEDSDEYYYDDY